MLNYALRLPKSNIVKKAVIFVHGFDETAFERFYFAKEFEKHLSGDIAFFAPNAPFKSDIEEANFQWYSINRFDPEAKRKNKHCLAKKYDEMGQGGNEVRFELENFIKSVSNNYKLDSKDIILIGYSQGTGVSLITALQMQKPVGAVINFCGMLIGKTYLKNNIKSKFPILLLHGLDDDIVIPYSSEVAKKELKELGLNSEVKFFENMGHNFNEESIKKLVNL